MMKNIHLLGRRKFLATMSGAGLALGSGLNFSPALAAVAPILMRKIPATGEQIPVIGMGSWVTFNVGTDIAVRTAGAEVLKTFFAEGGGMVDSSPMHGTAQDVIGWCLDH
jgi:hypothetical protein